MAEHLIGKIDEVDVQKFLLGELSGRKADIIQNVISTPEEKLSAESDVFIKKTFNKLTYLDGLLSQAAEESFVFPKQLERQINKALAKNNSKRSSNYNIKKLFNVMNLFSAVGGGALATACLLVILRTDTFFVDGEQDFESSFTTGKFDAISSQITQDRQEVFDSIKLPCDVEKVRKWLVSENFLYHIGSCSSYEGKFNLENIPVLKAGEEYSISVIPLKRFKLSVYLTMSDGVKITLLKSFTTNVGELLRLPNSKLENSKHTIEATKGLTAISFDTGLSETVSIDVKIM